MTATQLWAGLAMETLVRHYNLLLSLSLFVFQFICLSVCLSSLKFLS
jgi:hypothetical protein